MNSERRPIRIRRLATGVYQVDWPTGDALVVDTSRAAAPWLDLADILVHQSLERSAGATLAVVRLDSGSWLVSSRARRPVTVELACECRACVIVWATHCYRRTLAGLPLERSAGPESRQARPDDIGLWILDRGI